LNQITRSFSLLDDIVYSKSPDLLGWSYLVFLSHFAYAQHDLSNCLAMAWTVCEKLLSLVWEDYLSECSKNAILSAGQTFLNKERRNKLRDGRDYSASVIVEILSLAGKIPLDLYRDLTTARSARNKWLHEMKSVSVWQAITAMTAARKLILLTSGISLQIAQGSSFTF
jgi:hypothetical protein